MGATVAPGGPAHCLTSTPYLGERRYTHACVWRVGRGRQSHFIHRQSTMGRIRSDKWCQFIIYKAVREARGRRRHPKLHGPFYIFQLVPTLGPSTCVLIPFGVRTPQLVRPFLLEQQLREQASLAYLLFCVGVRVGSPRASPLDSPYVFIVYRPVLSLTGDNLFKTLPIFMHG